MPVSSQHSSATGEADTTIPDYWSASFGLRLLGDRWSMLIVRELLTGGAGFNALSRALPECSRTLLSNRLKHLQLHGIIDRDDTTSRHGTRSYRLTKAGHGLRETLEALGGWSRTWYEPYENDVRAGVKSLVDLMGRSIVPDLLPNPNFRIEFELTGEGQTYCASISAAAGRTVSEFGPRSESADLRVHVEPTVLHDLWWGLRSCETTRHQGDIGFTGAEEYADVFPRWFARPTRVAGTDPQ